MTTDFRALCAELLQAWDDLPWEYDWKGNPVGPLAEIDDTPFEHARAALAQPEPEFTAEEVEMIQAPWCYLAPAQPEPVGPTDDELLCLEDLRDAWNAQTDAVNSWDELGMDEIIWFAQHQAIARWGRPAITPIPLSERLPMAEDCDAQGRCWVFTPERHSDPRTAHSWHLTPAENIKVIARVATEEGDLSLIESVCPFWLPAHALPLPTAVDGPGG